MSVPHSETLCGFSKTNGVLEMFLKCFPWFDACDGEKCSERWGDAPVKVDTDPLEVQIFFNISLLGNKPADLYSLEVTRLFHHSGKTCEGNPSVSTQEETLLPKEGIPSQEEDQRGRHFLNHKRSSHASLSDIRCQDRKSAPKKRERINSNWSLGHK